MALLGTEVLAGMGVNPAKVTAGAGGIGLFRNRSERTSEDPETLERSFQGVGWSNERVAEDLRACLSQVDIQDRNI